ncbi:MAG: glycosyltransferase family 39 protein, partial [Acidobacteria bacterium]|nr:glycosyltransferase family 39 protein [Acidobacteriota bacterium]
AVRRGRPFYERRSLWLAFFAGLFVVLCLLRMPVPDRPIRDVDESVSAIIATTWLEGGVPYRDAIDQRGPVTYALYALTFLMSAPNDMTAVHWALLVLILVAAGAVFGLGRELIPGPRGGTLAFAAAALLALGTFTYRRSQMLAFHTEWPGMLASAVGMLFLWQALGREKAPRRNLLLAGICFGLAFLSKQPAVFDGGAAGAFLLLQAAVRRRLFAKETLLRAGLLAGGFFATVLTAVAYFAAHGALWDFYFYYWKYNVEHYTAVVPMSERLEGLNPFAHRRHYLTANPLLFAGAIASATAGLAAFFRRRQRTQEIWGRLLLVLWLFFAYFGASYSGRNFGHYFIQIIPPLCLLTAWLLVDLWQWQRPDAWFSQGRFAFRAALSVLVVLGLFYSLHRFHRDMAVFGITTPARVRVPQEALVQHLRSTTAEDDTLFVWGYNPEIYALTPRRAGTRYSNTNYLTGMLPWENHGEGVDTSEHIVPGAWDILLDELEASRPAVIVDTVPGNHRYYRKYPIEAFPRLDDYLRRHYRRSARVLDAKGRPYYDVYSRR